MCRSARDIYICAPQKKRTGIVSARIPSHHGDILQLCDAMHPAGLDIWSSEILVIEFQTVSTFHRWSHSVLRLFKLSGACCYVRLLLHNNLRCDTSAAEFGAYKKKCHADADGKKMHFFQVSNFNIYFIINKFRRSSFWSSFT